MSDQTRNTGDSPERKREKRDREREAEERTTDEGAANESAGTDRTAESLLEGVPASEANRPTG